MVYGVYREPRLLYVMYNEYRWMTQIQIETYALQMFWFMFANMEKSTIFRWKHSDYSFYGDLYFEFRLVTNVGKHRRKTKENNMNKLPDLVFLFPSFVFGFIFGFRFKKKTIQIGMYSNVFFIRLNSWTNWKWISNCLVLIYLYGMKLSESILKALYWSLFIVHLFR